MKIEVDADPDAAHKAAALTAAEADRAAAAELGANR
jgi:hypothetical protein